MCGPTGIGALYGRAELLKKLNPGFFGGGMVDQVVCGETSFAPAPAKFEAGTPNIAGAIGFGAACDYLEKIGIQEIENHIQEITEYAIEKLSEVAGLKFYSNIDAKKNVGVISFLIEGAHPHDTSEILGRHGIASRAGHHCAQPLVKSMDVYAVTRVSFYFYNSKEDIDKLILGIMEVKKMFA